MSVKKTILFIALCLSLVIACFESDPVIPTSVFTPVPIPTAIPIPMTAVVDAAASPAGPANPGLPGPPAVPAGAPKLPGPPAGPAHAAKTNTVPTTSKSDPQHNQTQILFEPQKAENCDNNIAFSPFTPNDLPLERYVYEPGIIFVDESFTLIIRKEEVLKENKDSDQFEVSEHMSHALTFGDDDVPRLFDDGTHGDFAPNDGIYTHTCVTVSNEARVEMFSTDDQNYVSFYDMWILNPNLRGSETIMNIGNGIQINDTGFFINIGHEYHRRWNDNWSLTNPSLCKACHTIWDRFGDQFDFFVIAQRDATGGAGYIRFHDNILGTGFSPKCDNRSYCYEIPDGKEHQRLIGIINAPWPQIQGITHELGHGLLGIEAFNFPGPGEEAWNSGDGMHIDSDSTVTGNLQGPFWDPDRGWPHSVRLLESGKPISDYQDGDGTKVYLIGNPTDGFRIKPLDQNRYIWSDIFLYMMGLLDPQEITETYYKLVNPHIEGCVTKEGPLVCTESLVTAKKVIPFTTDDFIEQFGTWNLAFGEQTNTWNLGVLYISDRPHTEAEITFLSEAWREYATSDTYGTKWADDIRWLFSTRGFNEIAIDATSLTGLTDE